MFNQLRMPSEWSTMKKLVWLRGNPATGQMGTDLTVSGTPPLTLPNSLGKPLKAWAVDLLPYQEGTGDPSPSNVRPIHGTDRLTIYTDSKYGGLVEWNQLCNTVNINAGAYGIVRTLVDGAPKGLHYTGTSENTTTYTATNNRNLIEGHKVLYDVGCDLPAGCRISLSNTAQDRAVILTIISDAYKSFGVIINSGTTVDFTAYPMIYDLTKMFGAGNEPTTVEQFKALFPADNYPYNAGQQMTVDQVNGAQYSPAVITLPQTVYTATISEQGGESGSGKLILTGTEDFFHAKTTTGHWRFGLYVTNAERSTAPNAISNMYKALTPNETYTGITGVSHNVNNSTLFICDEQYSTVEELKTFLAAQYAANTPVYIVYPLATPTTFSVPSVTIPTPTGTATAWATAEDGTVESMKVTYVGKA